MKSWKHFKQSRMRFMPSSGTLLSHLYCVFLCSTMTWTYVDAFNYETSSPSVITPPISSINSTSVNATTTTNTTSNSDYFGYSLSLRVTSLPTEITFLVGSPKARQPGDQTDGISPSLKPEFQERIGSGDIHSCPFSLSQTYAPCVSVRPPSVNKTTDPDVIDGRDALGLDINAQTNDGANVVACAANRAKICPASYLNTGQCSTSPDRGQTWTTESRGIDVECRETVDLMFVLDGSGSVNSSNFELVKEWVKTVSADFDITNNVDIGVIQYSGILPNRELENQPFIKAEIELGTYNSHRGFENAVDAIVYHGYTTYTSHAINKTVLEFMKSSRYDYSTNRKIAVLLTDGKSNDGELLEASAAYARDVGITFYAVGIGNFDIRELQIITNTTEPLGPNNTQVFGLTDFSDLNQIISTLQGSIAASLEGGSSGNTTNELQQAQVGFDGKQIEDCDDKQSNL